MLIRQLFTGLALASGGFFDLKDLGHELHQDVYINGHVSLEIIDEMQYLENRFAIVDSVLTRYQRPFTLLDIGASLGFLTFRKANLYPDSVFIMLEGSSPNSPLLSRQLESLCGLNTQATNVIWLDTPIIPEKFDLLSRVEHIDVVLALNLFHQFPERWEYLLASLQKISHVLIAEVPPLEMTLPPENRETLKNIHKKLSSLTKEIIEGLPKPCNPNLSSTFYVIENGTDFTLEATTLIRRPLGDREHKIFADYTTKTLTKVRLLDRFHESTTDWVPGINLITYLGFNGAFPTRSNLIHYLPFDPEHDDWMPNNFIVQGAKMSLIDKKDPKETVYLPYSQHFHKNIETFILDTHNDTLEDIEKKFYRIFD